MKHTESSSKLINTLSIIFVAGILLFLAISGAAALLRRPDADSYYENRRLASKPQASLSGVMDGSYFSSWNSFIQDHAPGRNTLLRLETLLNLKVLRRPVVNDVVVREDVLLGWTDYWLYGRQDLTRSVQETAERIAGHARTAEQYGGRFFYVAVPHQAMAFSGRFPGYMQSHEDYYADISSLLFPALKSLDVSALDMWQVFRDEGKLEDISSRTDNHFNITGSVELYEKLMELIAADTGFELRAMNSGEYAIEWLPNHFIGSRTRKLFDLWHSDEKLGILVPEDEVPFRRTDWADWLKEPKESSSVYELPSSPDSPVSYGLYMGGDWGKTIIETDRPEKPSILIYGDSFTNPVECIIWHDFNVMYSFDFRHYTEETLDELIARYQPDVVVCIRDYEAILRSEGNGQ
ncbi:MAG: hypothetical protein ILP09_08235 [Oscillospiraceae bacterium]|nr:hypothetical protein [Oscillospiraceae bacterium]